MEWRKKQSKTSSLKVTHVNASINKFLMKIVLIPTLLSCSSDFHFLPLRSADLRLSLASWMTMPSSYVVCWTCTRPRYKQSGCSGLRSCSWGRTCCSGMIRAEATSAVIPLTAQYCCSWKRVRDGCISCFFFFFFYHRNIWRCSMHLTSIRTTISYPQQSPCSGGLAHSGSLGMCEWWLLFVRITYFL